MFAAKCVSGLWPVQRPQTVWRRCIKIKPWSMRARALLNKFAAVKPAVEDINDLDPLGSGAPRLQASCSIPNQ